MLHEQHASVPIGDADALRWFHDVKTRAAVGRVLRHVSPSRRIAALAMLDAVGRSDVVTAVRQAVRPAA